MANNLKMDKVFAILTLHQAGFSNREIALRLGIDRESVGRHLRLAGPGSEPAGQAPLGSNPATEAPLGSGAPVEAAGDAPLGSEGSKPARQEPAGSGEERSGVQAAGGGGGISVRPTAPGDPAQLAAEGDTAVVGSNRSVGAASSDPGGPWGTVCLSERGNGPAGQSGSQGSGRPGGQASRCEPYRPVILGKLRQGLSAQRIYQDLVTEAGFAGSYYSVRRFVGKWTAGTELPFRRMECPPGQECQVDFGKGAAVLGPESRRRKSHLFRAVLSHSRKGYSEATFRQTTDDFLLCLENAFWDWGGVPRVTTIDNLKAAVQHPDWYDPELNPKVQSFCQHYGTAILPTKSYTPRHKGKVERAVGYAQENALKGRTFGSLGEENRHLGEWEATVADTRIHGTTRQQVGKVFQEVERPALLPLPAGRFPFFHEAQRWAHRDGHVEVAKAYYSVPPEYLGRRVWVRWDGHLVRIFNSRMEPLAVHAQHEPGQFSTQGRHLASRKISSVERGTTWLLARASRIGPQTEHWAQAMLLDRGIPGVRVLVGLNSLAGRYGAERVEQACGLALGHQLFRLRAIRELIRRGGDQQEEFEFLQEHEIIRGLDEYEQLVRASLRGGPAGDEDLWEEPAEPEPAVPADGAREGVPA